MPLTARLAGRNTDAEAWKRIGIHQRSCPVRRARIGQRREIELDIRVKAVRGGFVIAATLIEAHGKRPSPAQQIGERNPHLAMPGTQRLIETGYLGAQDVIVAKVVLQMMTDGAVFTGNRNTEPPQQRPRPDTRKLQKLWRPDAAGGQDHF